LALVIHHQLKLNMKGPRRRNIISSFWVIMKIKRAANKLQSFTNGCLKMTFYKRPFLRWPFCHQCCGC
jgi:hypothetical protein